MDWIEIKVNCNEPFRDILIAEMGELGFDSFIETEVGFDGYIMEETFSHPALQQLFNNYRKQTKIWYELKKIPKVNWNQEWENHYEPIQVGDSIYVRADFHEPHPEFAHEIVITPKMSFGTGHHETTHQLLALQLEVDHQGKKVLDVGTGTGILAIMAHQLGAASVSATDVDDWCIENASENFEKNGLQPLHLKQGVIASLDLNTDFDIILANINKNVLLDEMTAYASLLKAGGHIFLSGFYVEDVKELLNLTESLGFHLVKETSRKNWAALLMKKV